MLFDFVNIVRDSKGAIAIGASTSICAIMGLFVGGVIVMYFKGEDVQEQRRSVVIMLVSLLMISLLPGVDLFGHLGSLIAGILLGMIILSWGAPEGYEKLDKVKKVAIGVYALYSLMLFGIWVF